MKKVLIVGSGPAGISAALYLARTKIDVTVVSTGHSQLERANKIENYFGFSEPVSGKELLENGKKGAERLGVKFEYAEIVDLRLTADMKYEIFPNVGCNVYDCVLLATGSQRKTMNIKGVNEFEGRGVSYCAVCDAFFYRGKQVVVVGDGDYALHEAEVLEQTSSEVTILTNGNPLKTKLTGNIGLNQKKICELSGSKRLESVRFEDGSVIKADGAFIAIGVAGSTELAKKLGAIIEGNHIKTDRSMASSIPGLYAAGDCTGGLLQISKAVSDGAYAAMGIIKYLKSDNNKK